MFKAKQGQDEWSREMRQLQACAANFRYDGAAILESEHVRIARRARDCRAL